MTWDPKGKENTHQIYFKEPESDSEEEGSKLRVGRYRERGVLPIGREMENPHYTELLKIT